MKYIKPNLKIIVCEATCQITASESFIEDDDTGRTENNPSQLKRILPVIVRYNDLEPDIKKNLEGKKEKEIVYNFRYHPYFNSFQREFIISTYKLNDTYCSCDYTQVLGNGIIVYYNIYELIRPVLVQIRTKYSNKYEYDLSKKTRTKLPYLCKLFDNAKKNEIKPTYGLPFITFLDSECKYSLLCVVYKTDSIKDAKTISKLHEILTDILFKLQQEADEAGILDPISKKEFFVGYNLIKFSLSLTGIGI